MYHRILVYKVLLYQPAHLICLLDFSILRTRRCCWFRAGSSAVIAED